MLHLFQRYNGIAQEILEYLNINYLLKYNNNRYALLDIPKHCEFHKFLFLSKEYNKCMKSLLMEWFIFNKYIWFSNCDNTNCLYLISDNTKYKNNINVFNKSKKCENPDKKYELYLEKVEKDMYNEYMEYKYGKFVKFNKLNFIPKKKLIRKPILSIICN